MISSATTASFSRIEGGRVNVHNQSSPRLVVVREIFNVPKTAFTSKSPKHATCTMNDNNERNDLNVISRRKATVAFFSAFSFLSAEQLGSKTTKVAHAAKSQTVEEKERLKEQRRSAVRKAAEKAKETGVGAAAFDDSEYMLGEDHSPNAHSHQEEGSRESFV